MEIEREAPIATHESGQSVVSGRHGAEERGGLKAVRRSVEHLHKQRAQGEQRAAVA